MHRLTIVLEIVLIFILPVFWFLLRLGFWQQRLIVFEIFVGLLVLLAINHKMSWREMDFRLDNFWKSVKLLLPGTILAIIIILVLFKLNIGTKYFFSQWWKNIFFPYYVLLGTFSQEFGFRGYLLLRLKSLFRNPLLIILINALLFAWLHILHYRVFVIVEAFVFGAYLTWVYLKQPNIFATSLAHTLVGGMVIIMGFM